MGRARSSVGKSAAKVASDAQSSETESTDTGSTTRSASKSKSGTAKKSGKPQTNRRPSKATSRKSGAGKPSEAAGRRHRRIGEGRASASGGRRARRGNVAGRNRESAQALPAETVSGSRRVASGANPGERSPGSARSGFCCSSSATSPCNTASTSEIARFLMPSRSGTPRPSFGSRRFFFRLLRECRAWRCAGLRTDGNSAALARLADRQCGLALAQSRALLPAQSCRRGSQEPGMPASPKICGSPPTHRSISLPASLRPAVRRHLHRCALDHRRRTELLASPARHSPFPDFS